LSRILVIDDDDLVRNTLVRMLERAGFDVAAAKNGREGLARFHSEPPDLIVTDVIMPELDGIETIMALRQESPGIPIIAVSGGGKTHAMQFLDVAHKLGADIILPKPFRQADLVSAIARLLERGKHRKNVAQ
jgi:CheY-like chemotaxis protein